MCHGDFHMWNIAFRGDKSTPEDILFFDLQVLILFVLMDSSISICIKVCNTEVKTGVADIVQYLAQVLRI